MPKVVIPQSNFIEQDIYTQKYNIRYRIISDNQNNLSYWSPIFEIDPNIVFWRGTIEIPGTIFLDKLGSGFVSLAWDAVALYKESNGVFQNIGELLYYDIWIKWAGNGGAHPSDWIYKERLATTTLNINIPNSYVDSNGITRSSPKELSVEIYRPGRPISRYEQVYNFSQDSTTVDTTNNTILYEGGIEFPTGSPVIYTSSNPIPGLFNGATYYVRKLGNSKIALYSLPSQAFYDIDRIIFYNPITGTGTLSTYPFRMYSAEIQNL